MFTLRQRIFVIISVVIGIIIALLLLYYFVFQTESRPRQYFETLLKNNNAAEELEYSQSPNSGVSTSTPVFSEYSPEVYVKQVARIFVERFGSYSNQNDNQHINDVLPMVT